MKQLKTSQVDTKLSASAVKVNKFQDAADSLTNSHESGAWVQSRGQGSKVAGGENDLEFEVTEWKRLIWKKYKGKKIAFMLDTLRVANLQVTDVRVNKIMSQEKT